MSAFLYTVFSIAMHCNLGQDISPCVCAPHALKSRTLELTCNGVGSFDQIAGAFQNKISRDVDVWLKITDSQLQDLELRRFDDLNLNIKNLRLNNDQLRNLPEAAFRNLTKLEFLSLSHNDLEQIPRHILTNTPEVATLDLAQNWIRIVYEHDLKVLRKIRFLLLVNNRIKVLEQNSMPTTIRYLHLGLNNITTLNGTIRNLDQMEVLFINDNEIGSLDNELPEGSEKLMMIIAHHNRFTNLPRELETIPHLDSLYFSYNQIVSLDGIIKHGAFISNLFLDANRIDHLAKDEFQYCERLEILDLSHNYLMTLNRSLLPLSNLRSANFSHNLLVEFSLNELQGLQLLRVIDLSYNRIEKLTGRMDNLLEPLSFILEIRLDHNLLKSLDGAMIGFNKLRYLSLSHNLLRYLAPDDLFGLEELETLDVSHNYLQTLGETEKNFLPNLEKLDASFNNISKLHRDFHGLPNLCWADFSNNRISSISSQLVEKSRCIRHGIVSKLEIYLQENPILCHDNLSELVTVMEARDARIIGVAHCIVPKEDIGDAEAMPALFIAPSKPFVPTLLKTQMSLSNLPSGIDQQSPSIVQVIVPAKILATQQSMESTVIDINNAPIVNPKQPTLMDMLTTSTVSSNLGSSAGDKIKSTTISPVVRMDNPNLSNMNQANLDTDNTIYEKLSQIPQVIIANSDRGQHFTDMEDPSEIFSHQDALRNP